MGSYDPTSRIISRRAAVRVYSLNITDSDISNSVSELQTTRQCGKMNNGKSERHFETVLAQHLSLVTSRSQHAPPRLFVRATQQLSFTEQGWTEVEMNGTKHLSHGTPCTLTFVALSLRLLPLHEGASKLVPRVSLPQI